MKKGLFLLFIMLSSSFVDAQYIPTLKECNKWRIAIGEGMGSFRTYRYMANNDTILANETYKIVETRLDSIIGCVREDTIEQKLYTWDFETETDELLIDYSLEVGDTFYVYYASTIVTCDSIDYQYLYGKTRKVLYFGDLQYPFIEGIGKRRYGVATLTDYVEWLYDFKEESDTCYFIQPIVSVGDTSSNEPASIPIFDDFAIYPNPFTDAITVNWETDARGDMYLYNAQGQVVKQQYKSPARIHVIPTGDLPKGVYFFYFNEEGEEPQVRKLIKW